LLVQRRTFGRDMTLHFKDHKVGRILYYHSKGV
jgi:hypothetical protein